MYADHSVRSEVSLGRVSGRRSLQSAQPGCMILVHTLAYSSVIICPQGVGVRTGVICLNNYDSVIL